MASSTFEATRRARWGVPLIATLWLWLSPGGAFAAGEAANAGAARTSANAPKALVLDKAAARETATARLVEGVALLRDNQYALALAKFDEAYALVPSPNIHYNRGLAYVGLGRPAAALAAFEAFLAEADHPPEGKRDEARRHRDDLSRRVAHLAITTDPAGLEVLIDGESRGKTPLPRAVYVDPGAHELVARLAPGAATTQRSINVAAGQYLTVALPLAPLAMTAAPASTPAPAVPAKGREVPVTAAAGVPVASHESPGVDVDLARRSPPGWTYVAAAGGVALLGAGLTFGLLARAQGDALTEASQSPNKPRFDPDRETNGLRYQTLETVFLVTGGAALAAGAVGYLIARPRAAESARAPGPGRGLATVSAQPLLAPSVAGARVMVRF